MSSVRIPTERYCIASGRPVHPFPGDRCLEHGAADGPCITGERPALCQHPRLSPNHPYPCCDECGRDLRTDPGRLLSGRGFRVFFARERPESERLYDERVWLSVVESSLAGRGPHVRIYVGHDEHVQLNLTEAAAARDALDLFIAEARAGLLTEPAPTVQPDSPEASP